METFHGTTILSVRRDGAVSLGGDGQVTLGSVVVKATARKVRRLYNDRVLAGFAGATADAFTLFERFEAKLEKHQGQLARSAVELAKDWRSDRILRRLEAMLAVADRGASLIITGTGDVLEPEFGIVAIGSGGPYAQAAARALLEHTALSAAEIVKQSLTIAGDLCIYTNQHHVIETLDRQHERRRAVPSAIAPPRGAAPRASRSAGSTDYDVVIAGAGLVGLSLAPALVACRTHRGARRSRRRDDAAIRPADGEGWDARVYAISPGSAAFLRVAGRLAGAARRSHRCGRGDARGGRCGSPPSFLGVRARRTRARLDRRGARAARGARPRGAGGGRRDPRSVRARCADVEPGRRHAPSAPTARR